MDQNFRELQQWLVETSEEPLETMAGFFDARIGDYEAHMAPWQAHYQWMAEQLPEGIESLLDIGCGSGLELDAIFQRFPTLAVTGIDLSPAMLAKLRQKHGDKALTLRQADYFQCALGSQCFDAVVAFETLHHFTLAQKTALFKKLYHTLKPGGVFLECDYIATSPAIEELAFAECARRRQRDGLGEHVFVHFDTPLTLNHELQALQDGGFEQIEVLGFLPGDDHTPLIKASKKA